jgi:hypothetical protein
MLILTGACIGPRTTEQIVVAVIGLFLGAIINANIFGELAVLITSLNQKSSDFQNKVTQVNTTISNLGLPSGLRDKIRDFVLANEDGLQAQEEMSKFMDTISPSLREHVVNHDFYDVVQGQETFCFDQ